MIAAKGLTKTYSGPQGSVIRALGPLNLEVSAGEFVCVVGPSGCGKSTLLRLLAGLEPQSDGMLAIGNPHPSSFILHPSSFILHPSAFPPHPSSSPPSLVFQGDSTFPWMTVLDNVSYGLRVRGVSLKERDAVAARMIQLVGLSAFAEAYPYQLSGGMKQRVAIARALANDTDILLMDEPFGALDEQTRLALQNELLRIWEGAPNSQALPARKTVVFVTHSIDEAIILGDRVLVMSAAPGAFTAEFAVPFARPREAVALKRDPAFGELQFQVWKALGAQRGPT